MPAVDSFEFNRVVFDIDARDYRRRLDELVTLLAVTEVMRRPVRQLSRGERMKCELVAALLHAEILFLDEPTIRDGRGDAAGDRELDSRRYNVEHGATVDLTSHYMEDVVVLCPRILVIDGGQLRFDGSIEALTVADPSAAAAQRAGCSRRRESSWKRSGAWRRSRAIA